MYCDGGSVPTISAARPPRRCSSGRASAPQDTYRNPPHDAAVARVVVGRGQTPPADDGEDEGGGCAQVRKTTAKTRAKAKAGPEAKAKAKAEAKVVAEAWAEAKAKATRKAKRKAKAKSPMAAPTGDASCDNIRAILGS